MFHVERANALGARGRMAFAACSGAVEAHDAARLFECALALERRAVEARSRLGVDAAVAAIGRFAGAADGAAAARLAYIFDTRKILIEDVLAYDEFESESK